MGKKLQVVAPYKLPSPLSVKSTCFGKKYVVKIGPQKFIMLTPTIEWVKDEPVVRQPLISEDVDKYVNHFTAKSEEGWEKWHYWGKVTSYNPKEKKIIAAYMSSVVFLSETEEDITYSKYLHGRGHPEGKLVAEMLDSIDDWFTKLRIWVELVTDQDIDPMRIDDSTRSSGQGLQVMTVEDKIISIPASSSNITVTFGVPAKLTYALFVRLLNQVNLGNVPSDAHLLLRDSNIALRRGQYRRAVIDAGSATEITLVDFNDTVTHVNTGSKNQPLGWYTNQPTIISRANLPGDINLVLVDVRNAAIHQNVISTREQCKKALSAARNVVNRLDPLPV